MTVKRLQNTHEKAQLESPSSPGDEVATRVR